MVGMNIPRRTGTQVGYSNRSSVSIDFPKASLPWSPHGARTHGNNE